MDWIELTQSRVQCWASLNRWWAMYSFKAGNLLTSYVSMYFFFFF
jgi:hypothetical protein